MHLHVSTLQLPLLCALFALGAASSGSKAEPVMAWRLNAASLDGDSLVATVGPAAALSGGPLELEDSSGGMLFFDGVDDRAVVAADLSEVREFLPTRELTVSAWVSISTASDYGGVISVLQDNGGMEKGWVLGYGRQHFYLGLASVGADDGDGVMTYLEGESEYELGRLYHIVGTYDGEELCLYVNGELDNSSTLQSGDILYPSLAPVVLAGYRDSNEDFLHHGRLREISIFDQALSRKWIKTRFHRDAVLTRDEPLFPGVPLDVPTAEADPDHVSGQEWGPWHAIGPFAYGVGPTNMAEATVIERYLGLMEAGKAQVKLDKKHRGKFGAMTWRQVSGVVNPLALDVGTIDLNAVLKPDEAQGAWSDRSCAYLYRTLEMDEAGELELELGSDDGLRLWINGRLVRESAVARGLNIADDVVRLELTEGTNHILAKVVNGGGGWAFGMGRWEGVPSQAVNEAIDRGVKFLIDRQYADGSWGVHPEYGAGHTAYTVYTLLKCGVPPAHPAVQRAMSFVRSRPADYTYSLSCRILALCALHAEQDRELLASDVERLVDFQSGSGLVGYPIHPNGSVLPDDLSTTLYATLALHAASERGLNVPARTWRRLVLGALQCLGQEDTWDHPSKGRIKTAAFSYRPDAGYRGSMTSAGITILHLAEEVLGDKLESHLKRKASAGITGGLAWMERNMTWTINPGGGHHYFHIYGMERLGSLLKKRVVGGVDWYATGADYLLRVQQPEGGWYGDNALVDTLLALLFLERATAPSTGAKRDPDERLHLLESEEAGARFRVLAKAPVVVWLTGFGPKTLSEFEWGGESGLGPRVEYAEFLVKQPGAAEAEVVERVAVNSKEPLGVQRIDAQLDLWKTGVHEFGVRVCLLREPEDRDYVPEQAIVESSTLSVNLEGAFPPESLGYAQDHELCLLNKAQASFEASSKFGGGYEVSQAFDGKHDTRWECASNDANPSLKIRLRRSTRAGRMLFSHAWPRLNEKQLARVARFEVVINGRDTYTVTMDPHVLRKTELRFAKPIKVREIDIRILDARDGAVGSHKLGFSEVQLLK